MEPHCLRLVIFVLAIVSVRLLQNPVVASTEECDFPAIFNFGDSNSDTGGLSAAFGQAGPPHGESYFHAPAGRYCDGRLVVDFIGTLLSTINFFGFFYYSLTSTISLSPCDAFHLTWAS